jgi:hypothetical protein
MAVIARLLLLCVLSLLPSVANAQALSHTLRLQAATSLAQGSVAFANTEDGDQTLRRWSLGPSVSLQVGGGYGLSGRVVVGVTGAFEYASDLRWPEDGPSESRWTGELSPGSSAAGRVPKTWWTRPISLPCWLDFSSLVP